MTFVISVQCSTSWVIRPTGSWSLLPGCRRWTWMYNFNMWKSYMWNYLTVIGSTRLNMIIMIVTIMSTLYTTKCSLVYSGNYHALLLGRHHSWFSGFLAIFDSDIVINAFCGWKNLDLHGTIPNPWVAAGKKAFGHLRLWSATHDFIH